MFSVVDWADLRLSLWMNLLIHCLIKRSEIFRFLVLLPELFRQPLIRSSFIERTKHGTRGTARKVAILPHELFDTFDVRE